MNNGDNKTVAIWVAIVLIILVLVGYMVYYLRPAPAEIPETAGRAPAQKEDSVAAIDSELKNMNVDGLDSELADIDKELR